MSTVDVFKVKFLTNQTEKWEKVLQKPLAKLNSNLFRPANFANPSSFGQVMKMAEKGESNLDISQIFDSFTNELSLFSTQLSFYALIKSIELKKDLIYWWKFLSAEVLFRCKNVGRQRDFTNYWHFHQWIESFFNSIDFIKAQTLNWVEKRLNLLHWWKCQKLSKLRCGLTFSHRNKTFENIPLGNFLLNWVFFQLNWLY